jgi:hypothetical protein
MVRCEAIAYGGWQRCVRLTDGEQELIATTQVGPRIIRLSFVGEPSLFWEHPLQLGKTGGEEWRMYGGHRLWHAPEHPIRTYVPDNDPIEWEWDGTCLLLRQPTEPLTGIQKEMVIRWQDGQIEVKHRLLNRNLWAVRLAAWALSVMRAGGVALIPQEPYRPHPDALLPVRRIALWAYTDMSDPRLHWGKRLIRVRQDPHATAPLKIGVSNTLGWMAYRLGETVFVKQFDFDPEAEYPDGGCNTEVFTNAEMLELETLSPMTLLPPDGVLEHRERWSLHRIGKQAEDEALLQMLL